MNKTFFTMLLKIFNMVFQNKKDIEEVKQTQTKIIAMLGGNNETRKN
ncbi:MAG: hypothetical protein LBH40_03115 [Alphaproteobacteria bacterium]|jgi:hypothetical protein|nr:hypothetical protein [Alphaproteobacteria bacterium]